MKKFIEISAGFHLLLQHVREPLFVDTVYYLSASASQAIDSCHSIMHSAWTGWPLRCG